MGVLTHLFFSSIFRKSLFRKFRIKLSNGWHKRDYMHLIRGLNSEITAEESLQLYTLVIYTTLINIYVHKSFNGLHYATYFTD